MDELDTTALSVRDLHVTFNAGTPREVRAVDGVSFDLTRGRVLGVVGESGSGKSVTGLACLGLLPDSAQVSGQLLVGGQDMVSAPEKVREGVRGQQIAMVFQDALAALNPYRTVGRQIGDAYRLRHDATRAQAETRAAEVLGEVGIRDPQQAARRYPHEFSGGMRQRAMIAMAIVNEPSVLVADEPTTALDVTVQSQVLDLLVDLVQRLDMAMVLVTHDMGVVAEVADEVAVMYSGRLVETADVETIFERPGHPYTVGLLASMPRLDAVAGRLPTLPGVPASGVDRPPGCPFHPRCAVADSVGEACHTIVPELRERPGGPGHLAACHADASQVDALRATMTQRQGGQDG